MVHRPRSEIIRFDAGQSNWTLLAGHDVTWISGMAVDQVRQQLYWADLHQQVIERVSFNASHRKIVFKTEVPICLKVHYKIFIFPTIFLRKKNIL